MGPSLGSIGRAIDVNSGLAETFSCRAEARDYCDTRPVRFPAVLPVQEVIPKIDHSENHLIATHAYDKIPLNYTLTSLHPLPPEIREIIFDFAGYISHKPTLLNVLLTSKKNYLKYFDNLYSRVRLTATNAAPFFSHVLGLTQADIAADLDPHADKLYEYLIGVGNTILSWGPRTWFPSPILRRIYAASCVDVLILSDPKSVFITRDAILSFQSWVTYRPKDIWDPTRYKREGDQLIELQSCQWSLFYGLEWLVLGEEVLREMRDTTIDWQGIFSEMSSGAGKFNRHINVCCHFPNIDHLDVPTAALAPFLQKDIEDEGLDEGQIVCLHNVNPAHLRLPVQAEEMRIYLPPSDPSKPEAEAGFESIASMLKTYHGMAELPVDARE
ncbi:hypothetical protein L198_07223 [Cryptococcus wingfieldii CBS 7118]|uniref:Uncharacterized protein n=1 Tax=Cryptococcus wingfieldii CBS 7118 TaxID=1295528 RepID=A0A1E3IE44_9TREE|nr:hypothetical protein L198_07223 [Cryptococcus wingfieldii CBS 7118]ODN86857.1 hypothetical protein L198_07223 [Cryptococcus wingfieldii CBS 7118]